MKPRLIARYIVALSLAITPPLGGQSLIDRDDDGHSDIWQIAEDIPSGNGTDDSDGDGHSDADKEAAGTNPWSGLSLQPESNPHTSSAAYVERRIPKIKKHDHHARTRPSFGGYPDFPAALILSQHSSATSTLSTSQSP